MDEIHFSSLPITNAEGKGVPNHFLHHSRPAPRLAVLFPGLNYTCDMPLLYYTAQLLLARGADVLQLLTDYTGPDFQSLSRPEQAQRAAADAQAAVQEGRSRRPAAQLLLAGKSIGTLALAHLSAVLPGVPCIWLTPLLRQPLVVDAIRRARGPALLVGGTGDPAFDPQGLAHLAGLPHVQVFSANGANHSLEIPGEPLRSLEVLQAMLQAVDRWLPGPGGDRPDPAA